MSMLQFLDQLHILKSKSRRLSSRIVRIGSRRQIELCGLAVVNEIDRDLSRLDRIRFLRRTISK